MTAAVDEATDSDCAERADAETVLDTSELPRRRFSWARVTAYGLLPGLALVLALAAGYLKWQADSASQAQEATIQSVQAASEGTVAMLSYRPETVDKGLTAVRDRLTAPLRDQYSKLTHDVVIPGAKQKNISATATVPAAGSVSASGNHVTLGRRSGLPNGPQFISTLCQQLQLAVGIASRAVSGMAAVALTVRVPRDIPVEVESRMPARDRTAGTC
jgi:Mce-associated membrane protein